VPALQVKDLNTPVFSDDAVIEVVNWLCSDAAWFITGVSLPVEGGTAA